MNRYRASTQVSARSPFAGCAILIAALLVMVFLIGFSTVTLLRQFNEIARFTATKPVPVAVSPLEDQEAALNGLAVRLESFRQQLAGDGEAVLALSCDEINLAIAAYEPFRDFRGTLRVVAMDGDTMRIAIAFPLNGKPRLARKGEAGWITSDPQYLNGTLVARPVLRKQEVVLKIDTLEVTGARVPQQFVEQMSPYQITERYLIHPVLGPVMAKLTRAGIADGRLVLARTPGDTPADAIGRNQLDAASRRFFLIMGIAGCGVTGIVVVCRRRARNAGR